MGIEPFLVATSVHLICAQRLIRRICTECKTEVEMPRQAMIEAGFTPEEAKIGKIYKGKGCTNCNNSGYKGRIGLYEVLQFSDEIREMVLSGSTSIELKRKAIEEGMVSLRMAGLQKIREGVTTLEEVLRETVL